MHPSTAPPDSSPLPFCWPHPLPPPSLNYGIKATTDYPNTHPQNTPFPPIPSLNTAPSAVILHRDQPSKNRTQPARPAGLLTSLWSMQGWLNPQDPPGVLFQGATSPQSGGGGHSPNKLMLRTLPTLGQPLSLHQLQLQLCR